MKKIRLCDVIFSWLFEIYDTILFSLRLNIIKVHRIAAITFSQVLPRKIHALTCVYLSINTNVLLGCFAVSFCANYILMIFLIRR